MKTKTKTINPTNCISYFLTTYNLSYEKLAVKINSAVHDLDNNYGKITPRMVKEWAHGTLPRQLETEAITMVKFAHHSDNHNDDNLDTNDAKRWRELYFPDPDFTLKFIKLHVLKQVTKALNSQNIDKLINARTLTTQYLRLNDKDATLQALALIIITKCYFDIRNKILIGKEHKSYSFSSLKNSIIPHLREKIDNIDSNSAFVENTQNALRDELLEEGTNRVNIRRVALKAFIYVL